MKKTFALILLGLACLAAARKPETELPAPPTRFEAPAIDAYVAALVKKSDMVGVSFAVVREGKVELAKGYGKAVLEPAAPVTPDTLFAIGSITKQFTATCILLLAEEGKLSVQDKVNKYFPGLTRAGDIALLDLMNHVSGYPDYYPLDFLDRRMKAPTTEDAVIRQYAGGKLDFEPGAKYSYSNTGYLILGRIVELVSGESFGTYLRRRILQPLGMEHTLYDPESGRGGLAQGYVTFALGPQSPADREARGWIGAAGAIYSTATDLARWDLALSEGKVLKPASLALMTSPRRLADGRLSHYGCGLSLGERDGWITWGHDGAVSGFQAMNLVVPGQRAALIILQNCETGGPLTGRVREGLLPLLAPKPADVLPVISGPPALEAGEQFLRSLQRGKIDRGLLGEEFNWFLTDEKISGAAARLKPYGKITKAEKESQWERGGMEVSVIRFSFKTGSLKGLMYRSPEGKIQQFLVLGN